MANRPNVAQHVVPECYLKHFGDGEGKLHVLEKGTGRIFSAGPDALCKEKEIYTLLVNGRRDYSFERINNDVETALGPILKDLREGRRPASHDEERKVFTHLAVLTANLIARSRVLRHRLDSSLDLINRFLEEHPDALDDFPQDEYRRFLANPQDFPEILEKFPGGTRYLGILSELNDQVGNPAADGTIECLKSLKAVHYQVLLGPRTAATAGRMAEIGAKADLLVTENPRFISADDPVVFIADGVRESGVVPTSPRHWDEPGRAVYLPINPGTALLWSSDGRYAVKRVTPEVVNKFNAFVMQNAIRHCLASSPEDFSTAS